jgi:hypothetical protein
MPLIILYQILFKEISPAYKSKLLFSKNMNCNMVGNGTMVGIWVWITDAYKIHT